MTQPPRKSRPWLFVVVILGGTVVLMILAAFPTQTLPEPRVTIPQREAMEARAQAEDARLNALVANHKVDIGMTAVQCRAAWGDPRNVNRTVTVAGVSEQWVYGEAIRGATYLYFENGVMTSYQQSR